jgi:hypothetical protein
VQTCLSSFIDISYLFSVFRENCLLPNLLYSFSGTHLNLIPTINETISAALFVVMQALSFAEAQANQELQQRNHSLLANQNELPSFIASMFPQPNRSPIIALILSFFAQSYVFKNF